MEKTKIDELIEEVLNDESLGDRDSPQKLAKCLKIAVGALQSDIEFEDKHEKHCKCGCIDTVGHLARRALADINEIV